MFVRQRVATMFSVLIPRRYHKVISIYLHERALMKLRAARHPSAEDQARSRWYADRLRAWKGGGRLFALGSRKPC